MQEKMNSFKLSVGTFGLKNSLLIGFLIISYLFIFGGGSSNTSSTQSTYRDNSTASFVVSKNFVRTVLKSPSSADFPYMGTGQKVSENTYRVTSYVDSQNGFGAMIRSDYDITLRFIGGEPADPRDWEVIELIFDGEKLL